MRYDFETVIRRENAGSGKWDEIKRTLGCFPKDVIPFSVADMEFDMVPEVLLPDTKYPLQIIHVLFHF